jgi:hypothetical protein
MQIVSCQSNLTPCRALVRSIGILLRADPVAVAVLIAAAVVIAVTSVVGTGRSGPDRRGTHRSRTVSSPRIISSRITCYRATRATCYGITRADTGDGVCRPQAATVATAVDASGMHAASVKAAATSEPTTTAAAPASERVIRDKAGAD